MTDLRCWSVVGHSWHHGAVTASQRHILSADDNRPCSRGSCSVSDAVLVLAADRIHSTGSVTVCPSRAEHHELGLPAFRATLQVNKPRRRSREQTPTARSECPLPIDGHLPSVASDRQRGCVIAPRRGSTWLAGVGEIPPLHTQCLWLKLLAPKFTCAKWALLELNGLARCRSCSTRHANHSVALYVNAQEQEFWQYAPLGMYCVMQGMSAFDASRSTGVLCASRAVSRFLRAYENVTVLSRKSRVTSSFCAIFSMYVS